MSFADWLSFMNLQNALEIGDRKEKELLQHLDGVSRSARDTWVMVEVPSITLLLPRS